MQTISNINKANAPRTIGSVSKVKKNVAVESVQAEAPEMEVKGTTKGGGLITRPSGARTVGSTSGQSGSQSKSEVVSNITVTKKDRTTVENNQRAGAVINNSNEARSIEGVNESGKLFFDKKEDAKAISTIKQTEISEDRGSGRQFDNK